MSQVGGKAFDFKLFLKVMAYARPYRALFIFAVFLTIALGGLGTSRPILIRSVIDDAILMNDAPELIRLMLLLVSLLVIEALGQFGRWLLFWFVHCLSFQATRDHRDRHLGTKANWMYRCPN